MEKSIQLGESSAEGCSQVFKTIEDLISDVNQISQTVSNSAKEQSLNIQEIERAVQTIESTSNENQHLAENIKSSTQQFSSTISQLTIVTRELEELISGTSREGYQKSQNSDQSNDFLNSKSRTSQNKNLKVAG